MSRMKSTVKSCQAMQTTPKRLVRGWLPPTPPPIDESRSGPARSAVNQAKTHFEQEAELAIMHAKKNVLVTPTCGADMHRKGGDHKANRAVRRRDTMDDGLCVQCVRLCTSTKPHGGSWIPDPGSGIRDRGKRGGVRRGLGKGAPKGVHSTPSRRFIPSNLPKKHIHPQPAFQSCPRPSVRAWGGVALGNPWEKNANHRQRA